MAGYSWAQGLFWCITTHIGVTKYKNVGPGFWCDAEMGTSEAQAWFVPVAFLVNFFIPITTIIVCYTKINRKIHTFAGNLF